MAGIPPNWLGSIIQTQGAQQRAEKDKARETASQDAASEAGAFADRLQDVIEASDRDSQVYADAEGQGGQGRPHEGDEEEAPQQDAANPPPPVGPGLDIEA